MDVVADEEGNLVWSGHLRSLPQSESVQEFDYPITFDLEKRQLLDNEEGSPTLGKPMNLIGVLNDRAINQCILIRNSVVSMLQPLKEFQK